MTICGKYVNPFMPTFVKNGLSILVISFYRNNIVENVLRRVVNHKTSFSSPSNILLLYIYFSSYLTNNHTETIFEAISFENKWVITICSL